MNYSAGQTKAYQAVAASISAGVGVTYITGQAGTGKSTLLEGTVEDYPMPVLAPTGLAAIKVKGQTIHSFFGLRPGDFDKSTVGEKTRKIIKRAPAIAIDEISMVRADLLDQVDTILRNTLNPNLPFGGKPMVLYGDVWQIEPVVRPEEEEYIASKYRSPFFFDSRAFEFSSPKTIELTDIFRQKGDQRFIDALNRVREGWADTLPVFNERVDQQPGPHVLRLCMTNAKADAINDMRLRAIQAPHEKYEGVLRGEFGKELPAAQVLLLKVGARVMIVANNRDNGYVNGDLGTVVALAKEYVTVCLDRNGQNVHVKQYKWERISYSWDGEKLARDTTAEYSQIPIRMGWATTIHKSQGQTYREVHLELERRPHAHGMLYVGLSRCTSLAGLTLGRQLVAGDVVFNSRVMNWYQQEFGS